MSLKLFKPEGGSSNNLEPLFAENTNTQRIRWKNTWVFNLHGKIPLSNIDDDFEHCLGTKKMVRKHYGKKIQYVVWPEDLNALVSRSKLLKYVEIHSDFIENNCLKSKGNLVILGNTVHFRRNHFQYQKSLHVRKVLKCFQSAHIHIYFCQKLQLLKYMHALRSLYLDVELLKTLNIDSLGKAFRNLLRLETAKIEYKIRLAPIQETSSQKHRFFSRLNQLPRLKNLEFSSDYEVLKFMEQDLDEFCQQSHSFSFYFRISLGDRLIGKEENLALWKILNMVEEIRIEDCRNHLYISRDEKEVQKTINLGQRNVVEISMKCFEEKDKSKIEAELDYPSNPSIPFFQFFCQMKERCHSLRHLHLSLSTLYWNVRDSCENLNETVQEISTFEKLKTFELLAAPEDLRIFPLSKILSSKSLEKLQLRLFRVLKSSAILEWDDFLLANSASQIKELYIKVAKDVKAPLFGINLLNYIRKLEDLQVVQFIDGNLEVISFDFLYGLVTSLLDKKNMKRIFICTKVMNTVYSENFGELLSKSLETKLKDMMNEVSQDWEKRVNMLKDLQLEEIIVGKFNGYGFDYLFYQKGMQVVDKLFWKEKEIEELLSRKSQLASSYREVFRLFKLKEKNF